MATEAIAIASARLQIERTAEAILASDQKNLSTMVETQFTVGKAARSDVLTAQSQLVGDQTQIASLRQQLGLARRTFGRLDEPIAGRLGAAGLQHYRELHHAGPLLPSSVPSALWSISGPDIMAAEAQLHSASAAIGVRRGAATLVPAYQCLGGGHPAIDQPQQPNVRELINNLWNVGAESGSRRRSITAAQLEAQRQAAVRGLSGATRRPIARR